MLCTFWHFNWSIKWFINDIYAHLSLLFTFGASALQGVNFTSSLDLNVIIVLLCISVQSLNHTRNLLFIGKNVSKSPAYTVLFKRRWLETQPCFNEDLHTACTSYCINIQSNDKITPCLKPRSQDYTFFLIGLLHSQKLYTFFPPWLEHSHITRL